MPPPLHRPPDQLLWGARGGAAAWGAHGVGCVVQREEGGAAVVHAEGEPHEEDEDPVERPHRRRRRGMPGLVRVGVGVGEVGCGTPDLSKVGLCGLLREEGAKGTRGDSGEARSGTGGEPKTGTRGG
jgi:hypothetical protein